MKQIRIACAEGISINGERNFSSEWMAACQMNFWLLKRRLADAHAAYGASSHWIETSTAATVQVFNEVVAARPHPQNG